MRDQVCQIGFDGLPDCGAGFGWLRFWVQQVLQVDQPLPLTTIAFNLNCEKLATVRQNGQTP
jgi:hypothetical protein